MNRLLGFSVSYFFVWAVELREINNRPKKTISEERFKGRNFKGQNNMKMSQVETFVRERVAEFLLVFESRCAVRRMLREELSEGTVPKRPSSQRSTLTWSTLAKSVTKFPLPSSILRNWLCKWAEMLDRKRSRTYKSSTDSTSLLERTFYEAANRYPILSLHPIFASSSPLLLPSINRVQSCFYLVSFSLLVSSC